MKIEKRAIPLAGVLALACLLGCSVREAPKAGLTDAQFADLFVEVVALYDLYGEMPDSLLQHRQAVFDRRGIAPEDVAHFIAHRRENPEQWAPVLDTLRARLGDRAEVRLEAFGAHRARADTAGAKKNGP